MQASMLEAVVNVLSTACPEEPSAGAVTLIEINTINASTRVLTSRLWANTCTLINVHLTVLASEARKALALIAVDEVFAKPVCAAWVWRAFVDICLAQPISVARHAAAHKTVHLQHVHTATAMIKLGALLNAWKIDLLSHTYSIKVFTAEQMHKTSHTYPIASFTPLRISISQRKHSD